VIGEMRRPCADGPIKIIGGCQHGGLLKTKRDILHGKGREAVFYQKERGQGGKNKKGIRIALGKAHGDNRGRAAGG